MNPASGLLEVELELSYEVSENPGCYEIQRTEGKPLGDAADFFSFRGAYFFFHVWNFSMVLVQIEVFCLLLFTISESVVIFALNEGVQMKNGSDETMSTTNKCNDRELILRHMEALGRSLGILCDCFLARANDNDDDPLWKKFYRTQMCCYLIAKKDLKVTEPEGDMVHDLIRDCWADVKDYMENSAFGPVSNVDQWFKTIRIDFPLDIFDPDCTFFRQDVFSMCQKDTEKRQDGEAVPF